MFYSVSRQDKDTLVYIIGDKQPKGYGLQKTLAGGKPEFSESVSFWPIAIAAWTLPPGMIWFGVTHLADGAPANWFNFLSGLVMVIGIAASFIVLMVTGMLFSEAEFREEVPGDSYRDIRLFFARSMKDDRQKIVRMARSRKGLRSNDAPSMERLMGALDTIGICTRVIDVLSKETKLGARLKPEIDAYLLETVDTDTVYAEVKAALKRATNEDVASDIRTNTEASNELEVALTKYAELTASKLKQIVDEYDAERRKKISDDSSSASAKAFEAARALETKVEVGKIIHPFDAIVRESEGTSL